MPPASAGGERVLNLFDGLQKAPRSYIMIPWCFYHIKYSERRCEVGRFKKNTAVAFVDYEHWFYSYANKFGMVPNVEEWYDEISSEYKVKDVFFYGDFNNHAIGDELNRLQKFTKNVVHTASMKDGVDKDFTDFIILDAIYRAAAVKRSPDVFIIFTGDGHFDLAVKYLRELGKKVIIYAVKHALSNKLKSSANSYVEMPRQSQEHMYYIDMILTSMRHLKKKGKVATYRKTIENVASYNKVSKERVKATLDGMISQKYLYEEDAQFRGRSHKILKADWKRIDANFNKN